MKTKFTYERPLTEEIRMTEPVQLLDTSVYTNYNEVFTITYGTWDDEDD